MKKFLSVLLTALLLLLTAGCGEKTDIILDNSENSRFIDFYTDENCVYIECELNIYAEEASEVRISAADFDDVETGLLKNEKLVGVDKTGKETFSLKKGENRVSVLFRGDYAGVYMIAEREIPRFIKIEKI